MSVLISQIAYPNEDLFYERIRNGCCANCGSILEPDYCSSLMERYNVQNAHPIRCESCAQTEYTLFHSSHGETWFDAYFTP